MLHEGLLALVLFYSSEILVWREEERFRIKAVKMDNLRGLFGIRRIDRVPIARVSELCRVTKGVDEWSEERVLRWFRYIERMGNNRSVKRVYAG